MPASNLECPSRFDLFAWLEKLHGISRGIVKDDLRAAGTGDNFTAELNAGLTEALNLREKIGHLKVQPVPASGDGHAAIRQGPTS
jgi:hypothetical protein